MALAGSFGVVAAWLAYLHFERTPGEIIRYSERRLIGHPRLEYLSVPIFGLLRARIERPVTDPLPDLGKGQLTRSLPHQRYGAEGHPIATSISSATTPGSSSEPPIVIKSEADLSQAISNARPGQILEIAPGSYSMTRSIRIHNGGYAGHPIYLRAAVPGSVMIRSSAEEGFHLHAPYWVFENLVIQGVCPVHSNCEHAFHIVGKARNTVIRNNRIENFNAQIKVNGLADDWPDDGLIQFNTLSNTTRRDTGHPVTPIDIVGADRWLVADNRISNFIKGDGNQVSFGAFMKGNGSSGRIENNLIICTETNISQPGTRVGLSLGGGGTDIPLCRDKRCITEHSQGTIAHNVIAHCNDFGIYINKSNQSTIAGNTLINTYGIDVRFPASSATIAGNTLDGTIRSRDGAQVEAGGNRKEWVASFPQLPLAPSSAPERTQTPTK